MNDRQIVQLFWERSDSALQQVQQRYGDAMFSISYNILQNREDAEECVNDAYLGLWNAIPPARPQSLFSYACKVTRNISLTKRKHNTADKRNMYAVVSLETVGDCISSNVTVSDEMEGEELTRIWNDWLETLSRENRYVFMRRYWYMDPVAQIAKNMKLSQAAVYLLIDRMKKSLIKYLKQRGALL